MSSYDRVVTPNPPSRAAQAAAVAVEPRAATSVMAARRWPSRGSPTACGPLLPFAKVCFLLRAAVGAARQAVPGAGSCWGGRLRRLHCGARLRVVPANSLRSLRSLRSDRRRQVSLRSALRAPTRTLRSSSPQKSPAPGTACRAGAHGGVRRGAPPSSARSGRWGALRSEVKGETSAARPRAEERARTQTVLRTVCALRAPGAPSPGMSGVTHPSGLITRRHWRTRSGVRAAAAKGSNGPKAIAHARPFDRRTA
jgi:hypothetical protein